MYIRYVILCGGISHHIYLSYRTNKSEHNRDVSTLYRLRMKWLVGRFYCTTINSKMSHCLWHWVPFVLTLNSISTCSFFLCIKRLWVQSNITEIADGCTFIMYHNWISFFFTLGGDKVSTLAHTYPHKPLRKIKVIICNHQAGSPLYVWSGVWSDDMQV